MIIFGLSSQSIFERPVYYLDITYMYRLRTSRGGFVVPLKQNEYAAKAKELDGYGGWLGVYGLSVELACNSYKDYVASIEKQELLMKQEISQLI